MGTDLRSIERTGWDGRGNEGRGGRTLVDFAEDDDAGEFGLGVAGDDGVVEVYAWGLFNGFCIA